MDSQPTFPNSNQTGERQGGVKPEDLHAEAPAVEAADAAGPAPSVPEPPPLQAPPAMPPKLTPDEAAAAAGIMPAATPAPPAAPVVQGPAVAGDVDVIEAEWVEKAEDVVKHTQGDPYNEEEAIEDLQQDYLLKRYGHKVADSKPGDSKGP